MPGPFDPPSPMDPTGFTSFLDTPEIRRQRMFDTLGGISAALIRASAPSMHPLDAGSIIASGIAGGAASGHDAEDKYLKRAMVGSQVATAQSELARKAGMAKLLGGADFGAPPAPSSIVAAAPPGDYTATTGTLESGGNYTAPNALGSGAYGKYQFMPETWANVAAANPQLGLPTNMKQATPDHQEAAMRALTDMNTKALQGVGIQPTPISLYLAHRFGAQGAQTVLASDPNTPISSLFPPTWTQQNPDMQGKTVGQFVQTAGGKFGAPQNGGPVVPGMPIGDQPPRADGSGNPLQPAQYQPPQAANVPRPQTLRDVVRTIPPGMRQLMATMKPDDAMTHILKYADPGSEAVLDTRTNSVVFIPKTMVGRDPRYQPVEGAKLDMDRERLGMDREKAKREEANAKITLGPSGQPAPNETMLAYEQRLKAMEDQFKQAEEKRKEQGAQPEITFKNEKAIRNEYETQPAVKSYRTVVPMLESAKDAQTRPTRAADLNLVYAFAKLMDPDSVVRESETAGVVATASVADRVAAYVGQLNGQPMLNPDVRAKLIDELDSRFKSLKESNDVLAQQYTDIAKAHGLDPSRVVIPIRAPGRGPGGASDNQPSQDELKSWAAGANGGGVRLQFVPGKGVVPR